MVILVTVAAALAVAFHVFAFYLESFAWSGARARAAFGLKTDEQVEHTKGLALNQGYYNAFLAVAAVVGVVLLWLGHDAAAAGALFTSLGSMFGAGVVLLASAPGKAKAAGGQAIPPLVAMIALVIHLVA